MADFVSAPQVLDENEILLYGDFYKIKPPLRVSLATQLPGKIVIGDYGPRDNPLVSTYSISDLRGGIGVYKYTDTQAEANKFLDSVDTSLSTFQGIDTLWASQITLPPDIIDRTRPGVETGQISSITRLAATIIVTFGAVLYNITDAGTWSAVIDTLPAAPTSKPTWFNSRIFYPLSASGYSYQTAANAVAVDVATPLFQSFTVFDNKIYGVDTSNVLYSSTTGNSASWTTLATMPLESDIDFPFIRLVVYDNAEGDPTIWAQTHKGPWVYDPVNDKWFQSRFQHPYYRYPNVLYSPIAVWRESLFIVTRPRKVFKITIGGGTTLVEDVSPGLPGGFVQGTIAIQGLESTDLGLFALLGTSEQELSNANIITRILMWNGSGWAPIYNDSAGRGTPGRVLFYTTTATTVRLYFSDPTTVPRLLFLNLLGFSEPPINSTLRPYFSSGGFTTPWFIADYEAQQKLALRVLAKTLNATATRTVQIEFAINGSSTFTSLGTITSDTEVIYRFGTNNVGKAFKSIRFRVRFAGVAGATTAPILEYISFEFLRVPTVLRGYVVTIDCTDNYKGRTPRQQIDDLWTRLETTTLGTFSYRDDSGNTRSYLVKIMRPEGIEYSGYVESGLYTVYLAEFNAA